EWIETRCTEKFPLSHAINCLAAWVKEKPLLDNLANPHRLYLWDWLADVAPERSYELLLKLYDPAWLNYFIATFCDHPKRLRLVVELSQKKQDDRFLLSLGLIIVTQSAISVPSSRLLDPEACLRAWEYGFPKLITGRLKTFALLGVYGALSTRF